VLSKEDAGSAARRRSRRRHGLRGRAFRPFARARRFKARTATGWGRDKLVGISSVVAAVEEVIGSSFGDVLTGDAGTNVFRGEGGADRLAGGAGTDRLDGGSGGDRVDRGVGRDYCLNAEQRLRCP
jgi:Ca2+-binding RTX toxin-like protein